MASDSEASCVSDPNFAVICSFLEKFGASCGIASPDFLQLQEMLENTQELSQELIDIHIKLLRRIKRSVSADRWERVLIKVCHTYCSQDAWELERFGYRKARLSSKLRILKQLLEMQFDFHQKFKTEVNRLTASELRTEPIGRDKHGHAYWYQIDEHCQLRVYREDPDEETWVLVANNREGLVRLITQLASDDPNLADLVLNEDSNSLEIEKPILDTGQTSSSTSNCEAEADESSGGNVSSDPQTETSPVETSAAENSTPVEEKPESPPKVNKLKITLSTAAITTHKQEQKNETAVSTTVKNEEKMKSEDKSEEKSEKPVGINLSMPQTSKPTATKGVDLTSKRKKSINDLAVNLRLKSHDMLYKNPVQEQEMDLSVKKPRMDPKQFSSLSVPPFEPMSIESALRMSAEFADEEEMDDDDEEDDEFYDEDEISLPSHMKQPRLDRPTLLGNTKKKTYSDEEDEEEEYGEEIEEPVMLIHGEGSGRDCENENIRVNMSEDYSEAVEEPVMYFHGEGSGFDCDTGNTGKEEDTSSDKKPNDVIDSTSSDVKNNVNQSDTLKDNASALNSSSEVQTIVGEAKTEQCGLNCDSKDVISDSGGSKSKETSRQKIGTIVIDVKSGDRGQTSEAICPKKNSRWDIGKPVENSIQNVKIIDCSTEKELCDDSTNSSIKNNENSDLNLSTSKDETDNTISDISVTDVIKRSVNQLKEETRLINENRETSDTAVNTQEALTDHKIDSDEKRKQSMFFFGPGCFQFKAPMVPSPSSPKVKDLNMKIQNTTDQDNKTSTEKLSSLSDRVPTHINKADILIDNKEQTTIMKLNVSSEIKTAHDNIKDNITKENISENEQPECGTAENVENIKNDSEVTEKTCLQSDRIDKNEGICKSNNNSSVVHSKSQDEIINPAEVSNTDVECNKTSTKKYKEIPDAEINQAENVSTEQHETDKPKSKKQTSDNMASSKISILDTVENKQDYKKTENETSTEDSSGSVDDNINISSELTKNTDEDSSTKKESAEIIQQSNTASKQEISTKDIHTESDANDTNEATVTCKTEAKESIDSEEKDVVAREKRSESPTLAKQNEEVTEVSDDNKLKINQVEVSEKEVDAAEKHSESPTLVKKAEELTGVSDVDKLETNKTEVSEKETVAAVHSESPTLVTEPEVCDDNKPETNQTEVSEKETAVQSESPTLVTEAEELTEVCNVNKPETNQTEVSEKETVAAVHSESPTLVQEAEELTEECDVNKPESNQTEVSEKETVAAVQSESPTLVKEAEELTEVCDVNKPETNQTEVSEKEVGAAKIDSETPTLVTEAEVLTKAEIHTESPTLVEETEELTEVCDDNKLKISQTEVSEKETVAAEIHVESSTLVKEAEELTEVCDDNKLKTSQTEVSEKVVAAEIHSETPTLVTKAEIHSESPTIGEETEELTEDCDDNKLKTSQTEVSEKEVVAAEIHSESPTLAEETEELTEVCDDNNLKTNQIEVSELSTVTKKVEEITEVCDNNKQKTYQGEVLEKEVVTVEKCSESPILAAKNEEIPEVCVDNKLKTNQVEVSEKEVITSEKSSESAILAKETEETTDDKSETLSETLDSLTTLIDNKSDESDDQSLISKNDQNSAIDSKKFSENSVTKESECITSEEQTSTSEDKNSVLEESNQVTVNTENVAITSGEEMSATITSEDDNLKNIENEPEKVTSITCELTNNEVLPTNQCTDTDIENKTVTDTSPELEKESSVKSVISESTDDAITSTVNISEEKAKVESISEETVDKEVSSSITVEENTEDDSANNEIDSDSVSTEETTISSSELKINTSETVTNEQTVSNTSSTTENITSDLDINVVKENFSDSQSNETLKQEISVVDDANSSTDTRKPDEENVRSDISDDAISNRDKDVDEMEIDSKTESVSIDTQPSFSVTEESKDKLPVSEIMEHNTVTPESESKDVEDIPIIKEATITCPESKNKMEENNTVTGDKLTKDVIEKTKIIDVKIEEKVVDSSPISVCQTNERSKPEITVKEIPIKTREENETTVTNTDFTEETSKLETKESEETENKHIKSSTALNLTDSGSKLETDINEPITEIKNVENDNSVHTNIDTNLQTDLKLDAEVVESSAEINEAKNVNDKNVETVNIDKSVTDIDVKENEVKTDCISGEIKTDTNKEINEIKVNKNVESISEIETNEILKNEDSSDLKEIVKTVPVIAENISQNESLNISSAEDKIEVNDEDNNELKKNQVVVSEKENLIPSSEEGPSKELSDTKIVINFENKPTEATKNSEKVSQIKEVLPCKEENKHIKDSSTDLIVDTGTDNIKQNCNILKAPLLNKTEDPVKNIEEAKKESKIDSQLVEVNHVTAENSIENLKASVEKIGKDVFKESKINTEKTTSEKQDIVEKKPVHKKVIDAVQVQIDFEDSIAKNEVCKIIKGNEIKESQFEKVEDSISKNKEPKTIKVHEIKEPQVEDSTAKNKECKTIRGNEIKEPQVEKVEDSTAKNKEPKTKDTEIKEPQVEKVEDSTAKNKEPKTKDTEIKEPQVEKVEDSTAKNKECKTIKEPQVEKVEDSTAKNKKCKTIKGNEIKEPQVEKVEDSTAKNKEPKTKGTEIKEPQVEKVEDSIAKNKESKTITSNEIKEPQVEKVTKDKKNVNTKLNQDKSVADITDTSDKSKIIKKISNVTDKSKSDSVFDKLTESGDKLTAAESVQSDNAKIQKDITPSLDVIHSKETDNDSSDDDIRDSCDFEQGNDYKDDSDNEENDNISNKIEINEDKTNHTGLNIQGTKSKIVLKDINTLIDDKHKILVDNPLKSKIILNKVEVEKNKSDNISKIPVKSKRLETSDIVEIKKTDEKVADKLLQRKSKVKVQNVKEKKILPILTCVDITKLQAKSAPKLQNKTIVNLKQQSNVSSPKSLESIGVENEDSCDIIDIPETDPLALAEDEILLSKRLEQESIKKKPKGLSLATFKLDDTEETDTSALIPEPIARALRNRKISVEVPKTRKRNTDGAPEVSVVKKRRGRGRPPGNMGTRVIEIKDDSSSEEESPPEVKVTTPQRGTGKARRGRGRGRGRGAAQIERVVNDSPVVSSDPQSETSRTEVVASPAEQKTPRSRKKRKMLGLDIDPSVIIQPEGNKDSEEPTTRSSVRQSRRIAQIKIKQDAESRKIEELTHVDVEHKKKKKKDYDKDFKVEKKKKKAKEISEEEEESEEEVVETTSKRKHKKRRHQDLRKLFNTSNPWQSSSESSTNEEEEEEEVEDEPTDEEPAVLKSDHEFSPESDLENNAEVQPLRRARTVKKESDTEEPTDEHACQKCGKADHPEWILLCDKCDCGWHCSCLRPALLVIPEGDWFCPPCQHITLIEALKSQLIEYDKKMNRREMEVRRKERLAYVGISLDNVLPSKESEGSKQEADNDQDEGGSGEESSDSGSSSESGSSSGDESEPIYQLRQRRQAHSYRFNDYDELINSAIQDEMESAKGAGNQGRGKDIATIVNAEKEEVKALLEQQNVQEPEVEQPPPVVPVSEEKTRREPEESEDSSEDDRPRVVPKHSGRKKHRKLNSLDISSEDDADDDEDFKGTSASEEEDIEDLGSDDSDEEFGRRGRGRSGPTRRSTRARMTRFDKDFINDDSEDEAPKRKKSKSFWDESESEESDKSWGRRKKSKKQRQFPTPKSSKKSRKKKRRSNDSDPDVRKPKKPKIKYGGLDDTDDEEFQTRRTRGRKINYIDALGSDSEEDKKRKTAKPIESEDEYVANEEDEDPDEAEAAGAVEDEEKDSDSDSVDNRLPIQRKIIKIIAPSKVAKGRGKAGIPRPLHLKQVTPPVIPEPQPVEEPPADIEKEEEESKPPAPVDIPVIAANPDNLDEEEVETMMMENEEYAKKQLELMAIQLAKEKKKKEKEAKKVVEKKEVVIPPVATPIPAVPPLTPTQPKKRGRKSKSELEAIAAAKAAQEALSVSPVAINPALVPPPDSVDMIPPNPDMSPSTEIPATVPTVVSDLSNSPPKRRGRGKGKKTLAAEAAAADGSEKPDVVTAPTIIPPAASSNLNTMPNINIPTSTQNDPQNLSPNANLQGKLGIAAPPQPFSQNQPTPSVITRMLQSQPMSAQTFTTSANAMNQKYFPPGMPAEQQPPRGSPTGFPPGRGRVPSPYRQSPPAMGMYPGVRPMAPNSPHRLRSPGPPNMQMFHSTHHSMDPSPSGGGPINIAPPNRDRNSPGNVSKEGPTPPPPPYSRALTVNRFSPNETSPGPSIPPIRHHMFPQSSPPARAPPPGNFSPYHPPPPPNYHYGAYPPAPSLAAADDALPPTDYQGSPYPEQYNTAEGTVHSSEGSNSKPFDEEGSGEFGGLVSYFSSQREDDLDT